MLKIVFQYCFWFLIISSSFGQSKEFKTIIDQNIVGTIPIITVEELKNNYTQYQILDSREQQEFNTSHLDGAIHIGYTNFNIKKTCKLLSKDIPIVVYCSIGYRSEKIAEKLLKKGFQVYNLYGGIFHWKNEHYPVHNLNNQPTEEVHCFSKEWQQWLKSGVKVLK